MPKQRKRPPNTNVIEKWVGEHAKETGVAPARLGRWLRLMVLMAVLERARDDDDLPLFLLKGGSAMELRLQLSARATKDIDTAFRDSMDVMLPKLDAALQEGWNGFTFERTEPVPVGTTQSVRMEIKFSYGSKRWGTVQFEVAPTEGNAGDDVEVLEAIDIARFGLEGPDSVPCLGIRYQIAQKIHACTSPPIDGKDENLRFHDLIDLLLLGDLVSPDGWSEVRDACVDTFDVRKGHEWPPKVTVYGSWPAAYEAMARELDFHIDDVDEAASRVDELIANIEAAAAS